MVPTPPFYHNLYDNSTWSPFGVWRYQGFRTCTRCGRQGEFRYPG